jgi:hypothetical protein
LPALEKRLKIISFNSLRFGILFSFHDTEILKMIKKIFFVMILISCHGIFNEARGQWRGGEGQGRVGTGLKDSPNANAGVWYSTGLLDWIFVENLAKDRARANGHPNRYNEYLVRFMPEPQPFFNGRPPAFPVPNPAPPIPPPQAPVPPRTNYNYTYWASGTGIYKPGKPTDGNASLSENGKYNNPYREIRFAKIMYRGPADIDSYTAAVRNVLTTCKDNDQTHEVGEDGRFVVSPSKDVGPNRKYIFAWGDDISKDLGYVVVESVENGRIFCLSNKGQRRVATDNPTNFYDWYLGSYKGPVSGNNPARGARLAFVSEGQRNLFASVQVWLHQGNIAACFRIRDLQDRN